MTVPKKQREPLQRQAIENRWGAKKLNLEILKRFGSRKPYVGRHRSWPADVNEARFQLARHCDQWRRLYNSLCLPIDHKDGHLCVWGRLRPAVQKRIKEADRFLAKLNEAISQKTW